MGTKPRGPIFARSRRSLLASGLAVLGATAAFPALGAIVPGGQPHRLRFDNLHTGERLDTVYWADGRHLPEALKQVDWILRDFRANQQHPIDPALLDLLHALAARLDLARPFQVISGYRSPATNAMLAAASDGVAHRSLHMQGMAIDIRVEGLALAGLHDAALGLHGGGVGYYPRSDFVHVDVGRVRTW